MKSEATAKLKFIDTLIGREVRRHRKSAKVRQTALAPILGLDQSALSRVESGKQTLTAAQWVLFCHHMSIPNQLASTVRRKMRA